MQLNIITPDQELYNGEVSALVLPGSEGSFGILHDHAPIVSTLKEGEIKITESETNKETSFSIKGGVAEVNNNKIVILAE